MNPAQTTRALKDALAKRYSDSAWAFFPELRNGTGATFTRSADGFAMSLYPSRGIEFHGFEIKASVRDLTAEIRHPEKADAVGRFVDRWWIVTTKDVWKMKGADIPETWGVMILQDRGGLRIVKQAASIASEPMSRAMLSSIVLRSQKVGDAVLETARREARLEGFQAGRQRPGDKSQLEQLQRTASRLKGRIEKFEEASGIDIDVYDGEKIGFGLALMIRRQTAQREAKEECRRMIERLERALGT